MEIYKTPGYPPNLDSLGKRIFMMDWSKHYGPYRLVTVFAHGTTYAGKILQGGDTYLNVTRDDGSVVTIMDDQVESIESTDDPNNKPSFTSLYIAIGVIILSVILLVAVFKFDFGREFLDYLYSRLHNF